MAKVKVTALQIPVTDNVKSNFKTIKRNILSHIGSDWIVTPECALSGYFAPPTLHKSDTSTEETLADCLQELEDFQATQRTGLVLGTGWRETDGYPYNQTRMYNNQGNLVGTYKKRLLTRGPEGGGEMYHYLPGFQPSLFYADTSNEVIAIGVPYTRIIFAGNLAIMLLFLINGAFRGAGQAHLAMRTLWISNGINIFLDPLLIFGIGSFEGFGLEGAAWATTTGRSIGVIYQLYHLLNGKHRLVILKENIKLKWKTMRRIIEISMGGMGQFLIDSVAWIVLTRIIAEFGSASVAGFTIAFRILVFSLMPAWGLSAAASTLVGQNLGAKKVKRAVVSVWLTARYNVMFLSVITIIYLFLFRRLNKIKFCYFADVQYQHL